MAISCIHASISSVQTNIAPGDSHVGLSGLLGMTVVVGSHQQLTNCAININFLSIQHPDPITQVCRKGQPQQVGDLKQCCQRIDFPKGQDHPQNQKPEQKQP